MILKISASFSPTRPWVNNSALLVSHFFPFLRCCVLLHKSAKLQKSILCLQSWTYHRVISSIFDQFHHRCRAISERFVSSNRNYHKKFILPQNSYDLWVTDIPVDERIAERDKGFEDCGRSSRRRDHQWVRFR